MCGRIFQIQTIQRLMRIAGAARIKNTTNFQPTYNMGPTNYIAAIREVDEEDNSWSEYQQQDLEQNQPELQQKEESKEQQEQKDQQKSKRGLDFLKWGFQTSFSLIINARVEDMHSKPFFKPFLNTRRCVVMASGYYEWNKKKEPFMFKLKNGQQMLMAAMYTENDEVFVLTRDAFGDFEKVHDRMPVLLEEDEVDLWIDSKKNPFVEIIDRKILNQQKQIWTSVDYVQVAPHVNNMKEKSEKCLMTLEEYKDQQYKKGIGRFFQKKSVSQSTSKDINSQQDAPQTQLTDLIQQPEKSSKKE